MSEEKTQVNESLIGKKIVPFGKKFISMSSLLKNSLSLRTENQKYVKGKRSVPISDGLKNIILDIIFKNNFEPKEYYKLDEEEQRLFDDTCSFAGLLTHNIAKLTSNTSKTRAELTGKFNVLKGELLAGNNSPEILKKMRNILLELKAKNLISKAHYDKLLSEIVACI